MFKHINKKNLIDTFWYLLAMGSVLMFLGAVDIVRA